MNNDLTPASCEAAESSESGMLGKHVRSSLLDYFAQIDGHEVGNLYDMVIGEVEPALLRTVLEYCGFNQTKTAQALGLSRSTLRKKLSHYGIE